MRTGPIALTALMLASGTAAAQAPSNALCDFVQKVLAAKPGGLEVLKGEAQNPAVFKNEVFHGALLPNPNANCTLFLRSQAGRVTLPPRYSCTLDQQPDFTGANRVFARAAQDLRACLKEAMFSIMVDGDGKAPDESFDWIVSADGASFRIDLEMRAKEEINAGRQFRTLLVHLGSPVNARISSIEKEIPAEGIRGKARTAYAGKCLLRSRVSRSRSSARARESLDSIVPRGRFNASAISR